MVVALTDIADAGPIPKAVAAVITETADSLLTPKLTNIGNKDAIKSKLKPAAEGIATNSNWPIGITIEAAIYGYFLNNFKGFIAT